MEKYERRFEEKLERIVFIVIICFLLVLFLISGKNWKFNWESGTDKRIRRYKECQGDEQCIKVLDSIYPRQNDRSRTEREFEAAKEACNGELKYFKEGNHSEFECATLTMEEYENIRGKGEE